MNQTKINPALLRLLVIFPNFLSYTLLVGVIVYLITNYPILKEADALTFWIILLFVLAPMSFYTTYSIVKRIRAGIL